LRADADPVEAIRRSNGAVGLDRDGKPAPVQRVDQGGVHLQQRLAAGQDGEAVTCLPAPLPRYRVSQRVGACVASAQRAVGADESGITEAADSGLAVLLAPAPQIAARKAAEHGGAAGLRALALQGHENLFDRVAHDAFSFSIKKPVCRRASPATM